MGCLLLGAVLLGNLGMCATAQVPVMLAPPTQVRFVSVDYKNSLHWIPATNSTSLQYYVQWKIYGEPQWLDVDGCQGIDRRQCDLSGVTSDPREWYYARVRTSLFSNKSAWAISPRFSPRWDTIISPPVLLLSVTKKGVVVRVRPPRLLLQKLRGALHHKVYLIRSSGEEEEFDIDCCPNKLSLNKLEHNVEYCLQAQTIVALQARSSDRSPRMCITLV